MVNHAGQLNRCRRAGIWLAAALLGLSLASSASAAEDANKSVWAEAQISELSPYLQQTLIYMVLVVSNVSLERADYSPPTLSGASLQKLDAQPLNYPFNMQGRRYNITAFRYALTPLTLGKIRIPAAKIEAIPARGAYWRNSNRRDPIELSTESLELTIQPPGPVKPWLPLYGLKLSGKLQEGVTPHVGEPLSLSLTLEAVGADGEQLPSLESKLQSEDFKIYPELPKTSHEVIREGSALALAGKRVETYTLIPQRVGTLKLPELSLDWWSLNTHKVATTRWVPPTLKVSAAVNLPEGADGAEPADAGLISGTTLFVWLLVTIGVGLFGMGWWLGAGSPGRQSVENRLQRLRGWLGARWQSQRREFLRAWQERRRRVAASLDAHLPAPLKPLARGNLRGTGSRLVPRRLRLAGALRDIRAQTSPGGCARSLQSLAQAHLGLPSNSALPGIAQTLVETYPHLDAAALRHLLRELDAACYARDPAFDLGAWQARFHDRCMTLPLHAPRRRARFDAGLPALNP